MPRDEEDDFEDRPRRKRRDDRGEDGEDRPRRRRRDDYDGDEDDDFDDRPRRRNRLPRETLRGIAGNQRAIIFCILIYFCMIPVQFVIPEDYRMFVAFALIPLGLAATVFVFLLATKVYSTGLGILLGLLTLIPCIGLIVLLIINLQATSILKANGVNVGFFGASSADI